MQPSPTTCLDVSGKNRIIARRQHGEVAARNQNIDLQPHLDINNPLMTGPILGGVLRKKDTTPEYPPRSEGVNRSPRTPYVTEYEPEIPALWTILRKKRRPKEDCRARPILAATYRASVTMKTGRRPSVSAAFPTMEGKMPDMMR
jgi:hypothetical protein